MKIPLLLFLGLWMNQAVAQNHSFTFGQPSQEDLKMKSYSQDTSAVALYLKEFGEAWIDNDNFKLIYDYHARIKIFTQDGAARADIEIPLFHQKGREEKLLSVKASAFNIDNGVIRETKLNPKTIFKESRSSLWDVYKFAIPNVKAGTVIEYQYTIESPYVFNFHPWTFQSDIPKVESEYWATIPGNYVYNTTLRGFLKLASSKSEIIPKCLTYADGSADCARGMYVMKNIPALVEEDYMTAKSNFLAAINFELSEIKFFDGHVDRITKTWKDADQELKKEERFGAQVKRAADLVGKDVRQMWMNEQDLLRRAQMIHEFVGNHYSWNENGGMYTELGVKKAFEEKKGNVADINLSLVGLMRAAGLEASPVVLSTRSNGLPIEIHPVLSDFNYVLTGLKSGDQWILLDATDNLMPFGMIPERCLNGKGRVMAESGSLWTELIPIEKDKKVSVLDLTLDSHGKIAGSIQHTYYGYSALSKRRNVKGYSSQDAYLQNWQKNLTDISLKKYSLENLDDRALPLNEKMDVEIDVMDHLDVESFLLNPFFIGRQEKNPFRSSERMYPVDFGVPIEESVIVNLTYPENFEISGLPDKINVGLPGNGGRYGFAVVPGENRITVQNVLTISRTVFSYREYNALKELFSQMIQAQNIDLVFRRK